MLVSPMSYDQILSLLLFLTSGCLIFLGVFLAKRWRDASVHDALRKYQIWVDHWKEEERKQEEDAKEEKYILQSTLREKLAELWEQIGSLYHALYGVPWQGGLDAPWESGLSANLLSQPFVYELSALMRGLNLLQTPLEEGRVKENDLNAYHLWVEDMWGRFLLCLLNEGSELLRCEKDLGELREMHKEISEAYWIAEVNRPYQRLSGMIHLLEVLLDEGDVSSSIAASYIEALSKQSRVLVLGYEKQERQTRSCSSYSQWLCEAHPERVLHLKPLLASLSSSL